MYEERLRTLNLSMKNLHIYSDKMRRFRYSTTVVGHYGLIDFLDVDFSTFMAVSSSRSMRNEKRLNLLCCLETRSHLLIMHDCHTHSELKKQVFVACHIQIPYVCVCFSFAKIHAPRYIEIFVALLNPNVRINEFNSL